jgi:hypothetical protein
MTQASGKTLETLGKVLNPSLLPGTISNFVGNVLSPGVNWLSSNSVGLLYNDPTATFTFVLLFMVSLIVIIISDQVQMTAPLRTFMLKLHFVLVKCVRACTTIGLFFLGRSIGKSNTFMQGLEVGAPIVTAAGSLWVLLRTVEGLSMTVPQQNYSDEDGTLGSLPPIRGPGFIQSVFMVLRDYLSAVVTQCTDSLVGHSRRLGLDLKSPLVYSQNGALPTVNIRYLWQAQGIQFTNKSGDVFFHPTLPTTDQATESDLVTDLTDINANNKRDSYLAYDNNQKWYYSPLFVGLIAGFVSR